MGGWDDIGYYEEEAAQAAFIEETLKNISEEASETISAHTGMRSTGVSPNR
jgi:hypothetical protein